MTRRDHRILVLGAGYTGMMAALRVARRTRRHGGRVTLVNPSPRFTERLRMHQLATGQRLPERQIDDLIQGTGIELVLGWVTKLDPARHRVRVETAHGLRTLPYDTLVYAVGSVTDTGTIPGAPHAYTLNSPRAAARLHTRLTELANDGGAVTVAGAGLTGIEAAAEIADSYPELEVTLLSRTEPGTMMSEGARAYLHRALHRLGVRIRTGVEIIKILPDAVELANGELLHSDALLLTTGFRTSPLAAKAGLAVSADGRVLVDAALRSVSHPDIYAIGDTAAVPQSYGILHGTCQSGIPTAVHAADSIARHLRGKHPKPFRFAYFHQPVSLGRRDAIIQFTHPNDTPRRWYLTGEAAATYKELISSTPPKLYHLTKHFPIPASTLWPHGARHNPKPTTR